MALLGKIGLMSAVRFLDAAQGSLIRSSEQQLNELSKCSLHPIVGLCNLKC